MSVQDTIKSQIENNDVMLYMKGTPTFPQCGFSYDFSSNPNALVDTKYNPPYPK